MKHHLRQILIPAFLIFLTHTAFSQNDYGKILSRNIKKASLILEQKFKTDYFQDNSTDVARKPNPEVNFHSPLSVLNLNKERYLYPLLSQDTLSLGDTLVIGFVPDEELVIDSVWLHRGPVIVLDNGTLRFRNADATILGNLYTLENGQVICDSSVIRFPQQYFYQRSLIFTGNSAAVFRNSTLDFGGMVHTMALTDSAHLEMTDVHKTDFSTIAMYGNSSINIRNVEVAGEFIIDNNVDLAIAQAGTVLLWHVFRENSVAELSFPSGDFVEHYLFSNSLPDISGIDYTIHIDSCSNVMWGLMPSGGSDITVTGSEIRAIGLWFTGNDTTNVNGLVNNSYYSDFSPALTDRNLHLINSSVETWSLYTYNRSTVNLSGSILGEIGAMNGSTVQAQNYFLDGSGGYLWTTDTTLMVAAFSSLTSSLRSSGNSFLFFAYSTMTGGLVQALQNSVLFIIQSVVPDEITYDAAAAVWMANISSPVTGFSDSTVTVTGSAWIDAGTENIFTDFGNYALYYQPVDDTAVWFKAGGPYYHEVRKNTLIEWDTHGLQPGNYFLRLDLTDNNDNTVPAIKPVTLLPPVLGTSGITEAGEHFSLYPNPFSDKIICDFTLPAASGVHMEIFNTEGKRVKNIIMERQNAGKHKLTVNTSQLPKGVYYFRFEAGDVVKIGKVIK